MGLLLIVIKFLTLLSVAYCFSCPKGVHNFFHVDVSSGCRVYHQCLSSELLTLTCPFGQAFDDQSIKCVDASLVDCIKKPFSRHRRSAYSLKDRLILPIISEMMNDGSTKHHLGTIFRIAKSSYNGVQEEMKSNYGQPASRSTLMSAKYQFFSQTIGTMGMLVDKHLAQILKKMSENVSLIYSNMGVINNNAGNHGGSLTDKILAIC
ncbi:hypothetical protein CDAR_617311 [Caerostris darwini]|uniref:Chitin-binding type-2 domain-containing protein n=1 Tax=Caerostris darwini TaxID=1538125 RepID=A0AAV4X4B0_9ARAC|nr:hypothetical protein CDAR_617311 [Caerostris darwini]